MFLLFSKKKIVQPSPSMSTPSNPRDDNTIRFASGLGLTITFSDSDPNSVFPTIKFAFSCFSLSAN